MNQTVFNLNHPNLYKKTDYFVSKCNQEAFNVVHHWPITNWGVLPYPYSLFINGPNASGKTYLTHLWQQTTVTAKFIKSFNDLNNVVSNYIIIENCEEWDEEELFHAFNAINYAEKYLLLTANYDWKPILPDLLSRINSIKKVSLIPPDEEMVRVLVMAEFSKRSMQITPEILTFLSYRLSRDYEHIKHTIATIDNYCLTNRKKITIPIIKESIKF